MGATMNKPVRLSVSVLIILTILGSNACEFLPVSSEVRQKRAEANKNDIVIGVVGSSDTQNLFVAGVRLAIKEINQNGGISNREIKPLFFDEKGDLKQSLQISEKLSKNPEVIAVIGHNFSRTAIPASIVYENAGILLISSGATHLSFTQYGDKYTFRNVPSDKASATEMVAHLKQHHLMRVISLFDSQSYRKGLADLFHEKAIEQHLEIVAQKAYFPWQKNFQDVLSDIHKNYQFDVIFIAGLFPTAAEIIKQARLLGIHQPFISDYILDSPELLNIAGKEAENTIIATIFDPESPQKETSGFKERFDLEYGVEPDIWSALGYDAIQLFAQAIRQSHSIAPITLSSTLRFLENWNGVTGSYSFVSDGGITGKSYFFKQVQNEEFVFVDRNMRSDDLLSGQIKEFTLRLPISSRIQALDPAMMMDMNAIELSEQLFISLTDLDPETYESVPELASDWKISDNGTTYTFSLRKDVRWTDGQPVTAHDVVWALQRNIQAENKCPNVPALFIIKNARDIYYKKIKDIDQLAVTAINDYTLVFQLEYPAAYFPSMTSMGIFKPLPRHVIKKYNESWTELENIQSNGTYQIARWEKGVKIILRKNETYFDAENVKIPIIAYFLIPSNKVGLAMFQNQELDILGDAFLPIPSDEIYRISTTQQGSEIYYQEPNFCTQAFAFNTKRKPVDRLKVRQAISMAVNRELLVKCVTLGSQQVATTYTRPPIFGAVPPEEKVGISFNPNAAKKCLKQAGYFNGRDLPVLSLAYLQSDMNKKVAESIQSFMRQYLDVSLKIVALDMEGIIAENSGHSKHHIFQSGWCSDYPDANNWLNERFHPKDSLNPVGWENTEFSTLMDIAKRHSNPAIRKQLYRRAEEILCEDACVVMPLYFQTAHYLVNPRVKGWYHMAMGGQHIRDWYLEK
jgi:ABC-type oligopeptide transport system substrate-binding subunit/ABC-type branched-subunit amino acid transport system substrate-binding protein